MSTYENSHDDTPRFEPWLRVLASSLVPVFIAVYLPTRFSVPAIVVAVVLFVAGLVMLQRQTHRRRLNAARAESDRRPPVRTFERVPLEPEGAES